MTVNAPRLKSIVERIERLNEEKAAIQGDIKDIFTEANSVGYDVKTLRKVIAARKLPQSEREEQESLYETYMRALDGKVAAVVADVQSGALSLSEAAKAAGVSKSKLHRSVPKEENLGTIPEHDADGVITDNEATFEDVTPYDGVVSTLARETRVTEAPVGGIRDGVSAAPSPDAADPFEIPPHLDRRRERVNA